MFGWWPSKRLCSRGSPSLYNGCSSMGPRESFPGFPVDSGFLYWALQLKRLDCRPGGQRSPRIALNDVAISSRVKSFLYHVRGSGSDSVQLRKPDVKQNQVWLQFFRFLNGFQSVWDFTDDL